MGEVCPAVAGVFLEAVVFLRRLREVFGGEKKPVRASATISTWLEEQRRCQGLKISGCPMGARSVRL